MARVRVPIRSIPYSPWFTPTPPFAETCLGKTAAWWKRSKNSAQTPGGQGIVVYKGFKVATLSRADAEVLSPQDEKALRRAFNRWPT